MYVCIPHKKDRENESEREKFCLGMENGMKERKRRRYRKEEKGTFSYSRTHSRSELSERASKKIFTLNPSVKVHS